ncbi:MAG: MCE family protein [Bradyrhizobiaceae bacterium]|nr:MCE family protein [Bradyrhizobiaceae bacterium]
METRARFVLIGFFVLGVIVAGFAFVYWLNYAGGFRAQTVYRVRFEDSLPGLQAGSSVLFNGIRVGEVTALQLNPKDPREVTATISVDRSTPIRADTQVGVYSQGLMGSPTIALQGGSPSSPPPASTDGQPPLLNADPQASQDVMQSARTVLRRLDELLTENAEPIRNMVANLGIFADVLAKNSGRIDSIAAGLERMLGGGGEKPQPVTYDLRAPTSFPPLAKVPEGQLAVGEPSTVISLDTRRILTYAATGEAPTFADVQWSDNLPKLFQARIVQSFENAGYGKVDRDADNPEVDHKLLIDLRTVRLSVSPQPAGEIEFGAKIVDKDGRIVQSRIFRATAPAKAVDAAAAAAALDQAFSKAVTELVEWTLGAI